MVLELPDISHIAASVAGLDKEISACNMSWLLQSYTGTDLFSRTVD